ncbi:SymE family type I addiction module toxin [Gilliamella sp. B2865]|uniref:SymE family type I addiction module toxin n=1 Tax=Gilliamella sp. B2785 TaxID=2817982 RepID=UPI003A5CED49|nr:SymE family type I addiction module toxin [Gilliamella sp. B2785]MCX8679187.1 SymE family type I addiction module toxin [Gilliamella sp. B2865]
MAKAHSNLKSTPDKAPASQSNEQFYTDVPQGIKSNPRTQLTIKGRWLEQIGFYEGSPVIIKIEQGKLIIELTC